MGLGYEPGVAWTVMQELHRLHVHLKKNTYLTDRRAIDGTVVLETADKEGNVTRKGHPLRHPGLCRRCPPGRQPGPGPHRSGD